jgi:hypothetical protein
MTEITQNNCNVSALRPLEVTCNPTNASSPETQDGSIQLYINGGTSPYTVSWTNGAQGTYIGNLQSGNYTATVTDYYGDYTKTVTCTVGNNTFYLDEFIKCADNFNPNIYVFYDGTSLDASTATHASESIREWYQTKKTNGFGGLLYEGVIGKENHNSENWLWWSTYPYLGSLTGGTLSDGITEIKSFGIDGESVDYSLYDSNWCREDDNGKCVPRNSSFNFTTDVAGGLNSDIYKRINNGFTLTGPYGANDTRSLGVPFTVTTSMDGNGETVYGDFIGGDKNYMCIIISDEANGSIGLYHGNVTENIFGDIIKDDLFNHPFILSGTGWSATTQQEPTNRFTHDYESFLKVWEDIKNQDGTFEGYLYPVIEDKPDEIPFIQHLVGCVEGSTISATTFEEKYDTVITDVGPQNLNLSALTRTNVYSGMTGTTTYQNLNPIYKNGGGLKNFGWEVDPTVTGFQSNVVGNSLNSFFSGLTLSDEKIYITPITNLVKNKIYSFSGITGCYSYEQKLLSTGQTYSALTTTNVYDTCVECQPSTGNDPFQPTLCLSDGVVQYEFTPSGTGSNNYYVWYNSENSLTLNYNINLNRWEVTPWTNVGLGAMVRQVNEPIPTGGFINLGVTNSGNWSMSEGFCEGIPLTVTSNPSNETCLGNNNGEVILLGQGGTLPYQFRVQNVSPYPTYSITGIFYNLSPGNYLGEILDASGNTSSTTFTINSGEIGINYTVSLTSSVIFQSTGTRTWYYGVQVNPSLPAGVELSFNTVLTHTRVSRNQGTTTFNYSYNILKNGTLNIPYNSSTPSFTPTTTSCSTPTQEITTSFTDTSTTITYNSSDTNLTGTITQTVTVDGTGTSCIPACRATGTYNTSVSITNLTLTGSECSTAVNAFTPISENITIFDCSGS